MCHCQACVSHKSNVAYTIFSGSGNNWRKKRCLEGTFLIETFAGLAAFNQRVLCCVLDRDRGDIW